MSPEEAEAHFRKQGTLRDLFDKMDTNNDNAVSEAEAVAFKEKLAAQAGSTDIEQISNISQQK